MKKSRVNLVDYHKRLREQRLADGLCTSCGGIRSEARWKTCGTCRAKSLAKKRDKELELKNLAVIEEHKKRGSIDDVNEQAKNAGMSYGKWVAYMERRNGEQDAL